MSAREWVPGDVAIVVNFCGEEKVARFATHFRGDPRWVFSDGSELLASQVTVARRLVVLDIADLDWLPTRLRLDADRIGGVTAVKMRAIADDIEQQLEPPRPPEPMGDGAVVECRNGHRWVRIASQGESPDSPPWRHRGHTARRWESINVVRILSEGVTA